jgi:hypothetical protein
MAPANGPRVMHRGHVCSVWSRAGIARRNEPLTRRGKHTRFGPGGLAATRVASPRARPAARTAPPRGGGVRGGCQRSISGPARCFDMPRCNTGSARCAGCAALRRAGRSAPPGAGRSARAWHPRGWAGRGPQMEVGWPGLCAHALSAETSELRGARRFRIKIQA